MFLLRARAWRHTDHQPRGVVRADAEDGYLVRRAQEGYLDAYAELVDRHGQLAYRVALRLLGNHHDAEDVAQEALVAAWQQLPGFRGNSSYSTWLYQIVTRRTLNRIGRTRTDQSLDVLGDVASPADEPSRGAERNLTVDAVTEAVAALPPPQRVAIVLHHFEGLTNEEVARITGSTVPAVRSHLFRGRRTLTRTLQEWRLRTVPDSGQPAADIQVLDEAVTRIACGADADELLEQAADGLAGELTPHQRSCPQCQAALGEFSRIWEPVRSLAAGQVLLPAAVRAAVTSQIRRLTADAWCTLELTGAGVIRIAARVVAMIAREAGRQVPGTRVVFGRATRAEIAGRAEAATLRHRPGAAAGVLGRTAVVDLAVAADYGRDLDTVARAVQERAIAELRVKAGLKDVMVNVTIDDVI